MPEVLSQKEVERLLLAATKQRDRCLLMTAYATGLRVSELVRLKVSAIDSHRMMVRVEQGKGQKDRYTILSQRLLCELRCYWKEHRSPTYLFPNRKGGPISIDYAQKNIRELLGKTPIFGICLGHQLLSLALGGKTYKLKFGHRGGNQPVQRGEGHEVEITAQNHGFAVDADSLDPSEFEVTHLNLNDRTVEGIVHRTRPVFSVQYHPEAHPGPRDNEYIFREFVAQLRES